MIADIFKMKAILGLVFCALVMSKRIIMVESTLYTSTDTALKFSQCLIDKMSGSPFFTPDDRNSMIEVKNVLSQALLKTDQTQLSSKILITAFITSLADVIIHDDTSRNADRKQLYFSALEQCSLWSVGYADANFINEAQKILSIIEQNRAITYEELGSFSGAGSPVSGGSFGSVSYPQISGVNNPFPVQPSPVQSPSVPQYFFTNDKTVFDPQQNAQAPGIVTTAQVNANSQYAVQSSSQVDLSSSFGTGMKVQSGNPPQTFNLPSTLQTGGSFSSSFVPILQNQNSPVGSKASEISHYENGFRDPYRENFPYNYDMGRIPETNVNQPDVASNSESQQAEPVDGTSQTNNGGLTVPQVKESTVIVIPPNTDQKYASKEHLLQNQQHEIEKEMPQTSSLENAKPEISPSITNMQEQSQYSDASSYPTLESRIFNILVNSQKFRDMFNSEISQENAINFARVLTYQTFADYDLHVRNIALDVVTNEIAKVTAVTPENFALALSNTLAFILRRLDASLSANHSQVANNFIYSLDNSKQFNAQQSTVEKQSQDYYTAEIPGQYYTQTENDEKQSQEYNTGETPEEFYLPPEILQNPPPNYSTDEIAYSELRERERDFDFQSPPLSPEDRKDEMFSLSLAKCLSKSEVIRNFFCDENQPEDKVQISFSVIKASLTDYGLHVAPIAASIASGALSELSQEGLCNNYAETISEIVAETLEEKDIENPSAEDIARKMELNILQRQITPTEPQNPPENIDNLATSILKNDTSSDVPELQSSLTSIEEISPVYQEETENLNPITSSDTEDVSENEYPSSITLQQILTSLSTAKPTRNLEDLAPDGVPDQEALADYLTERFYALESYDLNRNKEEYENAKETLFIIETSSNQYGEVEDNFNPTTTEDDDKIFYQRDNGEISQEDKSYTYSTDPNAQISTVELQPSFQKPTPNSDDSKAEFQPETISPSTVFARQVSETAESSIAYIRSQYFDLNNLCSQINQLAPLVNIPALDYCEPISAIDYLLNVLRRVVTILNGV